jgi:hypothetical protein
MGKLFFRSLKMESAAYVEEAQRWAKALVHAESRFPGDYGPAMGRVASRIRVSFKLLWRLHYEPPKSLTVEKYSRLGEVYGVQERKFRRRPEAKTALGRALVGVADALDRGADALAGQDVGAVSDD